MEFVHAGSLGWLALAVPLALLYLVRPQRLRVTLATDQFWEAASAAPPWRTSLRRLRGWLSLLLHLALLALVVLALAEPTLALFAGQPRRVALILDNSASLAASDRWEQARRLADRQLRGLRSCDQAAVILAAAPAAVVSGLGDDLRVARQAVARAERSDAPGRLVDALALARRLLAGQQGAEVILVTDGCGPEIEKLNPGEELREPDGSKVRWTVLPVGKSLPNVGLTTFQARRCYGDPAGYEILLEVSNFSDQPAGRNLTITLNGEVIENKVISLGPDQAERKVYRESRVEGGVLEARLEPGDEFSTDDVAQAVLTPRTPRPARLYTDNSKSLAFVFVNHVLDQCDLLENPVKVLEVPAGRPAPAEPPGAAIPVYFGAVPSRLPDGPVLVLSPHGSCDLWELGPPVSDVSVDKAEGELVANLTRPDRLTFAGARLLKPREGVRQHIAAVNLDLQPLLLGLDRGVRGRVVVLNADLNEDLPLRTAFPVIVGNALTWLTQQGGEGLETTTTGRLAYVPLPPGAPAECTVVSPTQVRTRAEASAGRVAVGPVDRCGLWTVTDGTDQVLGQLAANLADAGESDLRQHLPPSLARTSVTEPAWLPDLPPWRILVVAALVVTVIEWGLYQRRRLA